MDFPRTVARRGDVDARCNRPTTLWRSAESVSKIVSAKGSGHHLDLRADQPAYRNFNLAAPEEQAERLWVQSAADLARSSLAQFAVVPWRTSFLCPSRCCVCTSSSDRECSLQPPCDRLTRHSERCPEVSMCRSSLPRNGGLPED